MLENLYLCGSNNNQPTYKREHQQVVICLKICTFAVATTTNKETIKPWNGCDLLENLYLCGSNNNRYIYCLLVCLL